MSISRTKGSVRVLFCAVSCIALFNVRPSFADVSAQAIEHYRQGLAYERLGRFDESYTQLQLAANLDPDSATVAVALGFLASRVGRYDEAVRALEHSIALDANSIASYYQLAMLYERSKTTDRALESWHRFLTLTQDDGLKTLAQKHIRTLELQPVSDPPTSEKGNSGNGAR